jgi:hypothetical protein
VGRCENSINQEITGTKSIILGTTLIALTFPLSIHAQGVPGGAARGAAEGGEAAGPLGAVVAVLPEAGVRYYDVPAEYGSARGYH